MFYKDFLKIARACPFCSKKNNRAIIEEKTAYLTYALAPYSKYHMLVVPKGHVISFSGLSRAEESDITKLLARGVKILRKLKINDFSILAREGSKQKSIEHLHFHIIPNHRIGDLDARGKKRKIMTENEIKNILSEIKKIT